MTQVTATLDNGETLSYDDQIATTDDGLAFYISQIGGLETKVYESKFRKIIFHDMIPVDTSQPDWVDNVSYISYNAVTIGKFIGASANDVPQADIEAAISTIPVFLGSSGYSYSLDELRKSSNLRIPIDATKATMAFRGFQEHAQRVGFFGDPDRGITGLFNGANVQLSNSAINYATATGSEIVAYLNANLKSVWLNSVETHLPDTQVIDSDSFAIISEREMGTGRDTTVLEYYKKNNLFTAITDQPLDVRQSYELNTAGAGGTKRIMAYEKTPENLVMHMPMSWRQLPPQANGLKINVAAEYKFGGVEFRYPGSAAYHDNVV